MTNIPTVRPYIPNRKDLKTVTPARIIDEIGVDAEELDTVAEFMDNYNQNILSQIPFQNRIIRLDRLAATVG